MTRLLTATVAAMTVLLALATSALGANPRLRGLLSIASAPVDPTAVPEVGPISSFCWDGIPDMVRLSQLPYSGPTWSTQVRVSTEYTNDKGLWKSYRFWRSGSKTDCINKSDLNNALAEVGKPKKGDSTFVVTLTTFRVGETPMLDDNEDGLDDKSGADIASAGASVRNFQVTYNPAAGLRSVFFVAPTSEGNQWLFHIDG